MKVSSRARRWVKEFAAAGSDQATKQRLIASLRPADMSGIIAAMDDSLTALELDVLYGLANLLSDGESIERFRKHCPVSTGTESNEGLIRLRDQLRQLWEDKDNSSGMDRQNVVTQWIGGAESLADPRRWNIFWQLGTFRPKLEFFRGVLAWAYCRHLALLKMCANPECPAKYFVANRRTQRYCCANDVCTQYAGRIAARRYWDRKGKQKRGRSMQKNKRAKGSL